MKFSKCMLYLNQALNYPALVLEDISLFFDAAIAELNTTLHTQIPLISEMLNEYTESEHSKMTNIVKLSLDKVSSQIPVSTSTAPVEVSEDNPVVVDTSTGRYRSLKIYSPIGGPVTSSIAYGFINTNGKLKFYKTFFVGTYANWQEITDAADNIDLDEYLPDEWVILYLIPYIGYKYSAREGGAAVTFADELTQGFQQLQESYDVPSTVSLLDNVEKLAYKKYVIENLSNLDIQVPTRAITSNMKHARSVLPTYGSLFDRGGF